MNYRRPLKVIVLLACSAFVCGCGNDGAGVKLAPFTGRITFKNEAITTGEIYLIPDAAKGTQGEMGSATLKPADGTFTITTYHPKGPRDGVTPGAYLLTLGLGRRTEKELEKFSNVRTTPLKIDVPDEGFTDVVIDLDKGVIVTK